MAETRLEEFLSTISEDLDRTVDFWMKYSIDEDYGGFFNCLSKTGSLYDDLKYGWLQGRQVWMLARLYNEVERFKRQDVLEAAEKGAEFIMKHLKDPNTWKCYFLLTRDGRPKKIQRTLFTETFYLMGVSEVARATQKKHFMEEAKGMMEKIMYWVQIDDTDLGHPKLSGNEPTCRMAVKLMSLLMVLQMITMDPSLEQEYTEFRQAMVQDLMKHVQRDGEVVLETISKDGTELPGSEGRSMCPGHAIEAGWFLLEHYKQLQSQDRAVTDRVVDVFITRPFKTGWDEVYGGLFNYMDADGHPPCIVEWDKKYWWAHNEALIALLMAYEQTEDNSHLERFAKVFDYCYSHFVDTEHGEWYGYLHRDGQVCVDYKGAAFKGCFHVPRQLYMCEQILHRLKAKAQ